MIMRIDYMRITQSIIYDQTQLGKHPRSESPHIDGGSESIIIPRGYVRRQSVISHASSYSLCTGSHTCTGGYHNIPPQGPNCHNQAPGHACMVKWHGGAGGMGLTMHGIWFDPFEMRLWAFSSCCDCL